MYCKGGNNLSSCNITTNSSDDMARANLNLKQEVIDAFINAQDDHGVRLVLVKIQDEDLVLDTIVQKVSSSHNDFEQLLPDNFRGETASFGLFRLVDDSSSGPQWALIAWVPDGCRVRDKMLYTSSREDLKRGLGLGYFKYEFSASMRTDFDWKLFTESQVRSNTVDILSETERMVLEEKTLTQAEIGASKASALGVIPFAVHDSVRAAWDDFVQGKINWVSLTLEGETVQLDSTKNVTIDQDLGSLARRDIASFVALKLNDLSGSSVSFFVFCCPEDVPIRVKMMMSSAKATVIGAAKEHNANFDKLLETRDMADFDSLIKSEINPGVDTAATAVPATISKPSRPGKGRAKVAKFQVEED